MSRQDAIEAAARDLVACADANAPPYVTPPCRCPQCKPLEILRLALAAPAEETYRQSQERIFGGKS